MLQVELVIQFVKNNILIGMFYYCIYRTLIAYTVYMCV